ncbi:hypothetical protein [Blastopirellula retiformator]|uniref:Uncharacterized protein n=1 Tax=Blastopirellula retiformator TaxID=2527970 RepID=A0A5C5UVN2_9BACT|nr:hypothetical protein [Blastopirellula retiformator]TWT29899.1 hypothetical protein Enr8_45550 [Blastopirellula retiformator]
MTFKYAIGVAVVLAASLSVTDIWARGGRSGGGGGGGRVGGGGGISRPSGGGGISRPSPASRTPSMSRPSASRPSVSRPNISAPSASRPSVSRPDHSNRPSINRPSTGGNTPNLSRPDLSNRPNINRPTTGDRPNLTKPDLSNRPNLNRPTTGDRPNLTKPDFANRPDLNRPGSGNRPDLSNRPNFSSRPSGDDLKNFLDLPGGGTRPGTGDRPDFANRPNLGDKTNIGDRVNIGGGDKTNIGGDRINIGGGDRTNINIGGGNKVNIGNRENNINSIRDHWSNYDNRHFGNRPFGNDWWGNPHYRNNPSWRWQAGWNRYPGNWCWRPAAWASFGTWFVWNWSQPVVYDYGTNVVYRDNYVYVNDQQTVTYEQYYQQADTIAASIPAEADPAEIEWMPLGVFAIAEENAVDTGMLIQLAVSKDGIIAGTFYNDATDDGRPLQGMVDKDSQRAAWKFADGKNPDIVMETAIYNLTQDESTALVHFGEDRTESWLMVRLPEPESDATTK